MPELGPLPPPAGPTPGPGFPAPAAPGRPPPPLPAVDPRLGEPISDLWGPIVDPALTAGATGLLDRPARLHAAAAPPWSVVTLLHTRAPMRHTPEPRIAFVDEAPLTVTAVRIPAGALPDAPPGTDLLSRLRMVHRRLLPRFAQRPVDAGWHQLAGRPAVLDRLAQATGGPVTGFSLAAAVADDGGLVVVGSAPPDRIETLHRVALPLAGTARMDGDRLAWATLPGWSDREELQLSTASVLAHVTLEPLPNGADVDGWTEVVFGRAPFLRDRHSLGHREVAVRGVREARLHRFDWQPPGGERVLTTVVTGTAECWGFSLVLDVPFEGPTPYLDPDAVLDLVEVRPVAPPTPLAPPEQVVVATGPPLTPAPTPPTPVLPPVPPPAEVARPPGRPTGDGRFASRLRGPRDRYLDAAIDRVMGAAIDNADADPDGPTVPPPASPGRIMGPTDNDVAAVRAVLDSILMRGWGPPLPWHGRMDVEALALARVERWRRIANLLVAATRPTPGTVQDEVWVTARLVAMAAAEAREYPVDERSGLAGVLDRVRRGLEDPDGAWDDSLATVLVARPQRYRLKTGFDGGSGRMLWAANADASDRWDYPVDHFDLPVPLPLARHVQSLVDRYDLDHPDVGRETRRFSSAEFAAFREDYLMTLDELRRVLGPAYVVEERGGLGPSF